MKYFKTYLRFLLTNYFPANKFTIRYFFKLSKNFDSLAVNLSVRKENNLHPKHRITNYHNYFVERIGITDKVLDIGSGNGYMTSIFAKDLGVPVTGIEIDKDNYQTAIENNGKSKNIKFILGDATKVLPDGKFSVITISNVLEHIKDRKKLIKNVNRKYKPKKWLIRVPMWNRDWRVPYMDELGIDSRLDDTHCIEYTEDSFRKEIEESGMVVKEMQIKWGEIWCTAIPKVKSAR